MELNTASALISFYTGLEDRIAKFYSGLADDEKYSEGCPTFKRFAEESKRHKEIVLRAYREVITDALEACFPIEGLNGDAYRIDVELGEVLSYLHALKRAIAIEDVSYSFCVHAGEKYGSMVPGISQAFKRVAKRKLMRKKTLKSLLDEQIA